MAVSAEQLVGLQKATLPVLDRNKWVSLAHDFEEYHLFGRILDKEKMSMESTFQNKWEIIPTDDDSAQMIGMSEPAESQQSDDIIEGSVYSRICRAHYDMDEMEEDINTGSKQKVISLRDQREFRCQMALANKMERQLLGKPASSADNKSLWGIQYWIFTPAESSLGSWSGFTNGGFVNYNLSDFSAGPGGVSAVDYPKSANWAQQYTSAADPDDLVYKVRHACNKTTFLSPVKYPENQKGAQRRTFATTETTQLALEKLARTQNDLNTNDLAYRDGMVTIRRIPVEWWAILDTLSNNPFYGLDFGVLHPFVDAKWEMKRKILGPTQHQPTVVRTFIFWRGNLKCVKRSRCFVLSQ